MAGLRELQKKHAIIGDVRGRGLMIGVELVRDRTDQGAGHRRAQRARRRPCSGAASSILGAGKNALRLAPPLVLTKEQADSVLGVLDASLAEVTPVASRSGDPVALHTAPALAVAFRHSDCRSPGIRQIRRGSRRGRARAPRVRNSCASLSHQTWRTRHRGERRRYDRVRRGQGAGDCGVWYCRRGGDPDKQRQVVSMAWDYVVRNGLTESRCRFDVVAIDGVGEAAVITVYPNAFEA